MRNRGQRGRACAAARVGCGAHRDVRGDDLESQVDRFISDYRPRRQRERAFDRSRADLPTAIRLAAMAMTKAGKRAAHHYRKPRHALAEGERRLQRARLQDCSGFHDLYCRIEDATSDVAGLGPLWVYDTALRIGAKLGLEPDRVYLHAGTRAGAKALGLAHRDPWLTRADMPSALRRLSPAEIEDFLCIFKDELRRLDTVSEAR